VTIDLGRKVFAINHSIVLHDRKQRTEYVFEPGLMPSQTPLLACTAKQRAH